MQEWVAAVLAAGAGTRMRSSQPKVLHPIAGAPMLHRVLETAASAGIIRRVVVVAPRADAVRAALPHDVTVAVQARPKGTADAVLAAMSACQGAAQVLVLNGDVPLLLPETLRRLLQDHEQTGATMSLLTAHLDHPSGLARIERGEDGSPIAIVEERDASPAIRALNEINAGIYCFRADWLWSHIGLVQPSRVTDELYLTELLRMATETGERVTISAVSADEVRGVNSRAELAVAEGIARQRIRQRLLDGGVWLPDPATVYIDEQVQVGRDTVIHANTHVWGKTVIGEGCTIGPNTIVRSSRIGDGCTVLASVVEEAVIENDVAIGPFSHLRPGATIERNAQIGNYAEVKQARIGAGTQMHHFSYIGDAIVGAGVNIGAGTITCNYDGQAKHQTHIGAGAFIGSDTMLVAPVAVGDRGRTGAGSVVTHDVAPGAIVVGVPARPFRPAKPPLEDEPGE